MPRSGVVLLFVLLSGCSASTRAVVRLDTGLGEPIVHTPRRDVELVAVSEKEFKKAVAQHAPAVPSVERPLEHARRVFGIPERSGWYRYEGGSQRLIASAPGNTRDLRLLPEDEELKRCYLLWCEHTWGVEIACACWWTSPSWMGMPGTRWPWRLLTARYWGR